MINDKKSVIFDFISPFIQTVKRNGQYLQKYQKLWKLTSVYEMTYRFVLGPTLLNSLDHQSGQKYNLQMGKELLP